MPTPSRARLRLYLLAFVFLCAANAYDIVATDELIRRGGQEWHPLVRRMMDEGPVVYRVWKLFLVTCGAGALLWAALFAERPRARKFASIAFWLAFAGFLALTAAHLVFLHLVTAPS